MLNLILGCVVGLLGGRVLYGALVEAAESGKHDAAD